MKPGEPLREIIMSGIYAGLRIQAEVLTLRKYADFERKALNS